MSIRATIPVLIALGIAAACSRSGDWPPHQDQLARVFDQQKAIFVVIEAEMAADGIKRMGPAIYAETDRSPVLQELPPGQTEKYMALFDSTQIYLDVTRFEGFTRFELLLQNVGPRLYLSSFVHTIVDDRLPKCTTAMQRAACGACSIRLESGWLLEYDWFPADPEAEAREC